MKRRTTRQREVVLHILQHSESHPTADAVYEEAKKTIHNISKGTVYRNLRLLCELGLISELNLDGTISRFESRQIIHYHFRCENCERIFDIDEPVHKELDEELAKRTGFIVSHHQMEFRGLCKDCQQNK